MKKYLVLAIVLTMSFMTFSQVGIKGGFALGVPTNQNNSTVFAGFDIGATYNITDDFRVEILYEGMFRSESNAFIKVTESLMPVTLGADYSFLNSRFRPYVGFNLGIYPIRVGSSGLGFKASDTKTYFGLYPKLGANYEISYNILLDLTFKYHVYFFNNNNANLKHPQLFGMNV